MIELGLLLLGLAILGFGGQLYLRQRSLVFRPRRAVSHSPAHLGLAFEELRLRCASGMEVDGWWVPGGITGKAVLLFHGSDGNIAYDLSTLRFLHILGVSVLMVDYPGYGRSDGRPSEQNCYEAAEAAWTFARQTKGFSGHDLIIYGHSLGSAVATYLAADRECGGLIFHAGFTSVPDMATIVYPYLPVRFFVHTKMDSVKRIAQCRCPFLALHSETDEHIPIAQAMRVYERAPGPKKLVRYRGPHRGTRWQFAPGVRDALEELFAGRLEHWERT